jgi:site-specific DNA-methyltransferase (adenine-specific)
MAVFAGTRMSDLMGLSIRLAGFEIRDTITWMYGSGFPKSRDISKDIDKAAGAQCEVIGTRGFTKNILGINVVQSINTQTTIPATDAAKQWDGWGTALKPASEPIIIARKSLAGTVAANVLEFGTGGINVDGCRVETTDRLVRPSVFRLDNEIYSKGLGAGTQIEPDGRWPANVVLSHAATPDGEDLCADGCVDGCPVAELDRQSGITKDGVAVNRNRNGEKPASVYGKYQVTTNDHGYGGEGGASRFFNVFRYQAKAPKSERPIVNGVSHPTVKPYALIEWLTRLLTPPRGIILDPFTGTCTVGCAGLTLGFNSICIENDPKYYPLIEKKITEHLLKERTSHRDQRPVWSA